MWGFLVAAFSVSYVPLIVLDSEQIDVISSGFANSNFQEDDYNADDDQNSSSDHHHHHHHDQRHRDDEWFEEQLEDDLKWSFSLNSVLHAVTSQFQDIALLDTPRFGKVLLIDGKMQSSENDEFVYHECLVQPALLIHDDPKTVFIMGGGEGSTAREALKHKDVQKVFMCDIDKVVVDFCRAHLTANQEAFHDERLHIAINDAKDELEKSEEKFDVIIGDLADPLEGGPCNDLYTKSFYEQVLKPKLNDNGIFVTQAGPAGILSYKQIFTPIYNTIKHVFKYVIAYTAHVPSYADSCGWVLVESSRIYSRSMFSLESFRASDEPLRLNVEQLNNRIQERIKGELRYLDGASIVSSTVLNKTIQTALLEETHVITKENARFIHGHGLAAATA